MWYSIIYVCVRVIASPLAYGEFPPWLAKKFDDSFAKLAKIFLTVVVRLINSILLHFRVHIDQKQEPFSILIVYIRHILPQSQKYTAGSDTIMLTYPVHNENKVSQLYLIRW